jgi:hypothetical protein
MAKRTVTLIIFLAMVFGAAGFAAAASSGWRWRGLWPSIRT